MAYNNSRNYGQDAEGILRNTLMEEATRRLSPFVMSCFDGWDVSTSVIDRSRTIRVVSVARGVKGFNLHAKCDIGLDLFGLEFVQAAEGIISFLEGLNHAKSEQEIEALMLLSRRKDGTYYDLRKSRPRTRESPPSHRPYMDKTW